MYMKKLRMLNVVNKTQQSQSGFSLVEIMIVLVLLGLIMTVAVPQLGNYLERGRLDTAKINMRILSERLKAYKRDCFQFPTTEQGLEGLMEKPGSGPECKNYQPGGYLENEAILNDPWGNPFIYESSARNKFTLISLGADGEEGGDEYDADISSDDL